MGDVSAVEQLVALLERSTTERLGVHRRELDKHDDELIELRDDIGKMFGEISQRLANIEQTQALQAQALATNTSVVSIAVKVFIGVAIAILAGALGIILFGPAS